MMVLTQIKAIFISLFLLFFVLLPTCIIALPFRINRRLKIVCPVWDFCSTMLLRHACEVHLDVQEDFRSDSFKGIPPYGLYVANHQSYVDIPLIITMYQAPPIMKKEVLYIPFFGWLGWISGALPVSRSSVNSRKKVFAQAKNRVMNEKIGLQVYPEGTRSKTSHPKAYEEIKRTLLVFAFNEKIPVIPTSIYGTRGVLTKHGFIKPKRHVGIIVHQEIDPKNFTSAEEFSRAVWGKVTQGYEEMRSRLGPLNENLS